MFRKYLVPALALFGFVMGIKTVIVGTQTPPPALPVSEPAVLPFAHVVAGSGIVEPSTESISIATNISGVIARVYVSVGQKVAVGDPLFLIDDRETRSKLEVNQAAVAVAKSGYQDLSEQFQLYSSIKDSRAVSAEELTKRKNAVTTAAQNVKLAQAQLSATLVELDRLTVRSPINAEVLQVKTRVGEYALAAATGTPLMLIGNTDLLHIRVDVDENDAWRIKKNARARAFLRGNAQRSTELNFVQFEPYVVPKRSLTGESNERVDTRVLQAIYQFSPDTFPVFVGQLVDVYVEEIKS